MRLQISAPWAGVRVTLPPHFGGTVCVEGRPGAQRPLINCSAAFRMRMLCGRVRVSGPTGNAAEDEDEIRIVAGGPVRLELHEAHLAKPAVWMLASRAARLHRVKRALGIAATMS